MLAMKVSCETCQIRKHGVFCDLSPEELRDLNKSKTMNIYRKRNIIFYEGNPCSGLFCVFSGKVKLYKHGPDGQGQIVRLAATGDLLGYRAFFCDEPYAATAEVLEESQICLMERNVVMRLMTRNPSIGLRIIKNICLTLRQSEERTVDLVQKPVPTRVAELLLALQESYGESTPQGFHLNINLTREEMAEMAGTRSETLIRILSAYRQQGILDIVRRRIVIKKPDKLKKILAP